MVCLCIAAALLILFHFSTDLGICTVAVTLVSYHVYSWCRKETGRLDLLLTIVSANLLVTMAFDGWIPFSTILMTGLVLWSCWRLLATMNDSPEAKAGA